MEMPANDLALNQTQSVLSQCISDMRQDQWGGSQTSSLWAASLGNRGGAALGMNGPVIGNPLGGVAISPACTTNNSKTRK